jgi:hypothetical protein
MVIHTLEYPYSNLCYLSILKYTKVLKYSAEERYTEGRSF